VKRKLISQGGGGFTLYLPKKWVEERKLKPGDDVEVAEINENLIISSASKAKKETVISLREETKQQVYIKLSHAYRMGFDRIIIHGMTPTLLKMIASVVNENLLGFEIVNKENSKCIIENITEPTDEKFSILIRRILFQIQETYHAIQKDFSNKGIENRDEIASIRTSLDKHVFFCRRIISKKINVEENSILHWELLTFLMHIQHSLYYLYEAYAKEREVTKETIDLFAKLEPIIRDYGKAYIEQDEQYLDDNERECRRLQEAISSQLEHPKSKDKLLLANLKEATRLVQIGGSPIRALIVEASEAAASKT